MNEFSILVDGERAVIRLYSLDEYETAGGVYHDEDGAPTECMDDLVYGDPSGAYDVTPEDFARLQVAARKEFLCAATVDRGGPQLPGNDILELAGVERRDYWLDAATGWFLLRDWPAEAPLSARMVEITD